MTNDLSSSSNECDTLECSSTSNILPYHPAVPPPSRSKLAVNRDNPIRRLLTLVLRGSLEDAALAITLAVRIQGASGVGLEGEVVAGPDLAFVVAEVFHFAGVAVCDDEAADKTGERADDGEIEHDGLHFGGWRGLLSGLLRVGLDVSVSVERFGDFGEN